MVLKLRALLLPCRVAAEAKLQRQVRRVLDRLIKRVEAKHAAELRRQQAARQASLSSVFWLSWQLMLPHIMLAHIA